AAFEAQDPSYAVRIRFLAPDEWFARLQPELRAGSSPFVSQLGTSWVPYFEHQGAAASTDTAPYLNDVRLLWYWRDLVRPEELRTWSGLRSAALRLRAEGYPPLALSTFRDPDLLWNFDTWLRAAGGRMLFTELRPLGWRGGHPVWRGWQVAALDSPAAGRAADCLIDLAEADALALPEISNLPLARDFLDRRYAMVVMEPWVASQAERRWREQPDWVRAAGLPADWQDAVGATLLPPLSGGRPGTFIGGSALAVLDPSHGR